MKLTRTTWYSFSRIAHFMRHANSIIILVLFGSVRFRSVQLLIDYFFCSTSTFCFEWHAMQVSSIAHSPFCKLIIIFRYVFFLLANDYNHQLSIHRPCHLIRPLYLPNLFIQYFVCCCFCTKKKNWPFNGKTHRNWFEWRFFFIFNNRPIDRKAINFSRK